MSNRVRQKKKIWFNSIKSANVEIKTGKNFFKTY